MGIYIAAFTPCGKALAERIAGEWKEEKVYIRTEIPLAEWTKGAFLSHGTLVFIGAMGIAVRAIAPFVKDKLTDSPVVVVDELGQYVIPVLSGHVGGANAFACKLADMLSATPVITTATDLHGIFSVDVFAKKNRLRIMNREGIAKVSMKLLRGEEIRIHLAHMGAEDRETLQEQAAFRWGTMLQITEDASAADVSVSEEMPDSCLLWLRPRSYVLGVGCRKGKSYKEIKEFLHRFCDESGISEQDIGELASISVKKEEDGLIQLAEGLDYEFVTFSPQRLSQEKGSFTESSFVNRTVGVDNVCERAAMAAAGAGARLIRKKTVGSGITLALAKKRWGVEF